MEDIFIERNYSPGDLSFIMSTWLRELHKEYNGPLPDKIWFNSHREYIEHILGSNKVDVKVLAAADEPNDIIGYAVAIRKEALIWIYIKPRFRGYKLAKRLLL